MASGDAAGTPFGVRIPNPAHYAPSGNVGRDQASPELARRTSRTSLRVKGSGVESLAFPSTGSWAVIGVRGMTLVGLVLVLSCATEARAGTFDVSACADRSDGANHSWIPT